ncbi:suppression of tumorigenicity 5 protein-like isoform X1 [Argonauta hians]
MDDESQQETQNLPPGRFNDIRLKFEQAKLASQVDNDNNSSNDNVFYNTIPVPKPAPRSVTVLPPKPTVKVKKLELEERLTPPVVIPRVKRDSLVKNESNEITQKEIVQSECNNSSHQLRPFLPNHKRGFSDCITNQNSNSFEKEKCESSTNFGNEYADCSHNGLNKSKSFQAPKKPDIAARPAHFNRDCLPHTKVSRHSSVRDYCRNPSATNISPLCNSTKSQVDLMDKENSESKIPKIPPKPFNLPSGTPPKKPPRTYKHDLFLKNKEAVVFKDNELYETTVLSKVCKPKTENAHKRPPRPPPPRPPAPKSPLSDKEKGLRNSFKNISSNSRSPISNSVISDMGKSNSNFSLRRCLSVESIHPENKSNGNNAIYLETSKFGRSRDDLDALSNVEVYVDEEGYAVPYKFYVKDAPNSSNSKDSSKQFDFAEKIQHLRRRFGDPTLKTTNTPTKNLSGSDHKLNRGKVNLVRQKINQSYSVMHKPSKQTIEALQPERTLSENDSDADSLVDESEIKKRVEYCSTIRSKTSERVKKSLRVLDKIYPQLFEYVICVGLRLNTEKMKYEPYVIYKFPEIVDSNLSIPHFCFPDAETYPLEDEMNSKSYWFVLTNFDGARVFGYCRRVWPYGPKLTPEVICIITPIEAVNMYNSLLLELESRRLRSPEDMQELMASSFGRPLPSPGKCVTIRAMNGKGEVDVIELKRPVDTHLEGFNFECLLSLLGIEKLIWIFSTLLVERNIILCSKNLSVLSQAIHSLITLLYPFQWQHTYVPILPSNMLEIVCSPTPYLVGILSTHLSDLKNMPIDEVVILDLDRKHFVSNIGDESSILPKKLQKALKSALETARNDIDTDGSKNLMISEAFLRLFVELVGHTESYILTQQNGERVFQKEQFIRSVNSKSIRKFLEWFTETQMFDVFRHSLLEMSNSLELFLTRVFEQSNDNSTAGVKSNVRDLGKKMKNFGKALKTKFHT